LRHFDFLSEPARDALFAVPPQPLRPDADRAQLALGLGATFYSPGTRARLGEDSRRAAGIGTTSHVWCLEDSIAHDAVGWAQANVVRSLRALTDRDRLPMLFVRVRSPEQTVEVARQAGDAAHRLTGFVLPKFRPGPEGEAWLQAVEQASAVAGSRLLAMPVLEHEDLAWRETRGEHLQAVRALLDRHRQRVLAVRVGGTDLCGLFGLRRDRDTTIWDVAVVRDMLADVINTFSRRGDYIVSGPVWEHFSGCTPSWSGTTSTSCSARCRWTAPTASPARPSSTPRTSRSSTRCTRSPARSTTMRWSCWPAGAPAASCARRPAAR